MKNKVPPKSLTFWGHLSMERILFIKYFTKTSKML